jgi:hypothetical protein
MAYDAGKDLAREFTCVLFDEKIHFLPVERSFFFGTELTMSTFFPISGKSTDSYYSGYENDLLSSELREIDGVLSTTIENRYKICFKIADHLSDNDIFAVQQEIKLVLLRHVSEEGSEEAEDEEGIEKSHPSDLDLPQQLFRLFTNAALDTAVEALTLIKNHLNP